MKGFLRVLSQDGRAQPLQNPSKRLKNKQVTIESLVLQKAPRKQTQKNKHILRGHVAPAPKSNTLKKLA